MKIGILLAAGLGKRMKSQIPKVLFDVMGEPMCMSPLRALMKACDKVIVVVGHRGEDVKAALLAGARGSFGEEIVALKVKFVTQDQQRGTGHAVRLAVESLQGHFSEQDVFVVANGDSGLLRATSVEELLTLAEQKKYQAVCASMSVENPSGLGRILRDSRGVFMGIREEADASLAEKKINEVNGGLYVFSAALMRSDLMDLQSSNAQGEFYLTDLLKPGQAEAHLLSCAEDLLGANTTWELAQMRKIARNRWYQELAESYGIDFLNPETCYIAKTVKFFGAAQIGLGVVIKGHSEIGAEAIFDGQCHLQNVRIGPATHIRWGTVASEAIIGANCKVGPMAHLRPGTILEDDVSMGNFVETKKMKLGKGAKVNHLSYLGDGEVGENTNVGCGTITCNFDGFAKHRTVIGKNAFIGSDTQLIAPIEVGDGAYVASGTTLTDDVPAGAFALARANLVIKPGYAQKLAEKMKAKKKDGGAS